MNFELDQQRVLDTILQLPEVSAQAREEGALLVDGWIQECLEYDLKDETLAVEAGFYIQLDERTFVVGTQDRLARDEEGVFGCEWKSTKHRTKTWGPEEWYTSISKGHQVATYAAGLQCGYFLLSENDPIFSGYFGDLARGLYHNNPIRILVRAVSKSKPPEIWPTPEGQFVHVSPERIESVLNTFRNTAESLRAMQKSGAVPWQVPGLHCTNCFRYQCEFKRQCDSGEIVASGPLLNLKAHSPGSQKVVQRLVEMGKIDVDRCEDVVVLSASGLSTVQQCNERWRLTNLAGEGELNENLDIGSVLHAGLAEMYSQIRNWKEGE